LARKLERAVEALYAEIRKLPPQPRAAILGRLDGVRVELRATFASFIKPGTALSEPEWMGAPTQRRRRRSKR
jgi:hypothetical protein